MRTLKFWIFLGISCVLHVIIFSFLQRIPESPVNQAKESIEIEIKSFEKKEDVNLAKQIVEQSLTSVNEEVDPKAKYLSAKNQKVEKETAARKKGEFQNIQKPTTKQALENLKKDLFKTYDLGNPTKSLNEAAKKQNPGNGEESQTNDYLKNVEEGLETVLNSREFKYYSYYTRIRQQLNLYWQSKVREKLTKIYKETKKPIPTDKDHVTKVIVVLNNRGTLSTVQVISDSGIRDLDDAAVEAFREAAPFPNPPKDLVEADGLVKIRWDFVLEN